MYDTILPPYFSYTKNLVHQSDSVFSCLSQELDRQSYPITMFGKTMMQPRLVAFYGDVGVSYRYSQTTVSGTGWHPLLKKIKQSIITLYPQAQTLNSVLCNLYRDGQDSMGWHADNEKELGSDPIIYSVTLGAGRDFHIKSRDGLQKYDIILENNSLLMMGSGSQIDYIHSIPKTKKNILPRINLTFRTII